VLRLCYALGEPDEDTPPIPLLVNRLRGNNESPTCSCLSTGRLQRRARAFASEPAADAGRLLGITGLLAEEHQHSRPSTSPMSLAELETVALANNPEIRVAMYRVAIAERRVRSAGSLSDPEFMYRGWGKPLAKPWD